MLKKLLEILLGLFLILMDFVKGLYDIITSMVFFAIGKQKKRNDFLFFIYHGGFFVFLTVILLVFLIFAQVDVFLALGAVIVFSFIYFNAAKSWVEVNISCRSFKEDQMVSGGLFGIALSTILILFFTFNTPYSYTKLGSINLQEESIYIGEIESGGEVRSSTKIVVDNLERSLIIDGCDVGKTYFYEGKVNFKYFNTIFSKYVADCSNAYNPQINFTKDKK